MFPKQAANSLVTETLQYFVFFCRSVYYVNLVKCLIINDLRLIIAILFFIAFLNITYTARHTFATMMLTLGADLYTTSKLLGHADVKMTQVYAKIINQKKDDAVNLVNGLFD